MNPPKTFPGIFPPICAASIAGDALALRRMLASKQPDSETTAFGMRPLHHAAYAGKARAVRTLIRTGSNPNALEGELYSPLFLAVAQGDPLCIRMLLRAKADPDWVSFDGASAKLLAAHKAALTPQALPALAEMVRYGIDFTAQSPTKIHPLQILVGNPQLWSFFLSIQKPQEQDRLIAWKKTLSASV